MFSRKKLIRFLSLTVIAVLVLEILLFLRPLPRIKTISTLSTPSTGQAIDLTWPAASQIALAARGYGLLATHGSQTPSPTASVAKVITALVVLQKKQLAVGQQGAILTLDAADVAFYQKYVAKNGSVVPVAIGEQISEYQVLQAMMLPSANNMADSLAAWAFGSTDAYVIYANQWLKTAGLAKTHVADASGFEPQTTSTAQDLVALGQMILNSPVLAQIVSQPQAQIPVAGTIKNTNSLLGSDGIIGIKTGETAEAGGCYLFAVKRTISGHSVMLVGAIMGATNRNAAIDAAKSLMTQVDSGFEDITIAKAGQPVGYYKSPWGQMAQATVQKDTDILVWKGSDLKLSPDLISIKAPTAKGQVVGSLKITSRQQTQTIPLVLKEPLDKPPLSWRLFR